MADIKGIIIEIGGETTKLQKAMDDVVQKGRDIDKELRAVNTSLKFNPKNTELLEQKQRLLAEAIANTKAKLDTLREADKQAKSQLDSGTLGQAEYDALRREVIKTEDQLKSFETQLKNTGKTSEQMAEDLKKTGKKLQDIGGKLTVRVTAPIVGVGVAGFKMAADLEDAMGATEQVFKDSSDDVKTWADNLESYYGIAKGEALEHVNVMGSMLKNIGGLTEEEAAKQAQTLLELAGDLSATFGGTTEDAVRALTGALKGNNSMLDNYAIAANEGSIKARALKDGIWDGIEPMTQAEKQAAVLAEIMDQTADAQGQAAREADGASGSMKSMTTEIKNLTTEIGEELLPIITPILQDLKDWIQKFRDLDQGTKDLVLKMLGLAALGGPVLMFTGGVAKGIGSLIDLFGKLKGAGAIKGATDAIGGAGGLTNTIGGGSTGLMGKLASLAGPVGIPLAIAMLVAYTKSTDDANTKTHTYSNSIAGDWQDMARKAGMSVNGVATETEDAFSRAYQAAYEKSQAISTAVASGMDQAKNEVITRRNSLANALSDMSWTVPVPRLPKFAIEGSFDVLNRRAPQVVSWYDKGGIFTSPSIIGVGEKRPEFVGALDDLKAIVADVIDSRQGPGIVIQNMSVREEADIQRIAHELYKMQRRGL